MTRSDGGASCFRAFEREFDYVYRTLLRFGVTISDAEDLVQDVFLVTWRRWADFDPGRPVRPWLAGIAFKVASEHFKRRRRWEPRAWLDPPDQAPGGEELLAATRARVLALRSLQALEEQQRWLIVLHDLDGVSMREIAGLLGVPLFTGYSRLRAARRAFSDVVDRHLRQAPGPAAAEALPGAVALLALEKTPPPAPADTRRRALSRLRGLVLLVPGSTPAPRPIGRAVSRGQALALGTAALVLTAGVVTVAKGSGAARPATAGKTPRSRPRPPEDCPPSARRSRRCRSRAKPRSRVHLEQAPQRPPGRSILARPWTDRPLDVRRGRFGARPRSLRQRQPLRSAIPQVRRAARSSDRPTPANRSRGSPARPSGSMVGRSSPACGPSRSLSFAPRSPSPSGPSRCAGPAGRC